MAITVIWDDVERTIILQTHEDPWDWEDFRAAALQASAMIERVSYRVDMIFDLTKTGPIPSAAVEEGRRTLGIWPENLGNVAVVSEQPLVNVIVSVFNQYYTRDRQLVRVDTLTAARAVLRDLRD